MKNIYNVKRLHTYYFLFVNWHFINRLGSWRFMARARDRINVL